jgi:hypothetical protein
MTKYEKQVCEALTRAVYRPDTDYQYCQIFVETMHPTVRKYGYLSEDEAVELCTPLVFPRLVSSLAQQMVHGPEKRHVDQGMNGSPYIQARLPRIVDGPTGYELPPGHKLIIEYLRFDRFAYRGLDHYNGGFETQPTFKMRLECRWNLAQA